MGSPPTSSNPPGRKRDLAFCLLLIAATIGVYSVSLNAPFFFDDLHHVVNNKGIRDLTNPRAILSSSVDETRPVHLLTLALSYWMGNGYHPWVFRLFNVLIHACCGVLLFFFLCRLRDDLSARGVHDPGLLRGFPELGSMLFALHPLATESVTYVNSRSGLLAALFGMAALLAFLRSLDDGRRHGRSLRVVSVLLMLLAMGSKEFAAVFPILMVGYLALIHRDGHDLLRRRWRQLLPHFASIGLIALLYLTRRSPHTGTFGFELLPLVDYWLTQLKVHVYFVTLCAVPFSQNIDYDFPVSHSLLEWQVLGALGILLGIAVVGWRSRRAAPLLTLCIGWFFIALAPTNSLIPFRDILAERHIYLSLMAFCTATAFGLCQLIGYLSARSTQLRVLLGLGVALCCAAACLTVRRNHVLSEPLRLWQDTVRKSPNKARPHLNLGILLIERGLRRDGYSHLKRAFDLAPRNHHVLYNLAVYHRQTRQPERAIPFLRRAYGVRKGAFYRMELTRALIRNGISAYRRRQVGTAIACLTEATTVMPGYYGGHYNLAMVLVQEKQYARALPHLGKSMKLRPDHRPTRVLLRHVAEKLRAAQITN